MVLFIGTPSDINLTIFFPMSLPYWVTGSPTSLLGGFSETEKGHRPSLDRAAWKEGLPTDLIPLNVSTQISKILKIMRRATVSNSMNVHFKLQFSNQQWHLGNLLEMLLLDPILHLLSQKFWIGIEQRCSSQSLHKVHRFWCTLKFERHWHMRNHWKLSLLSFGSHSELSNFIYCGRIF